MKWKPQTWNDILALLLIVAIIGVYVAVGAGVLPDLPGEIIGSLIAAFALVVQFYFRKSKPPSDDDLEPFEPHG